MDYRKIYNELPPENRTKIFDLHQAAQAVCDYLDWLVEQGATREQTDLAVKYLEKLEFDMQDAWRFDKDSKMHTWWLRPKSCLCPKIDNLDPAYYGNGKIIVSSCPLHGYEVKEEKK